MKLYSKFQISKFKLTEVQGSTFDVRCSVFDVRCSMFLLLLGLWTSSSAQQTNTPDRLDYSSFKIITDRNIFNSRRSARYAPLTETRPPGRVDSFALAGTMSYEKGPFAFFDGSSSDYRKALQINGAIAGFKVSDIEPAYVKLASPTNEIELRVGMQLRREDNGEWHLSERPESPSASPERSAPSRGAVAAPARSESAPPTPAGTGESIIFVDPDTQAIIREPLIEGAISNAVPGTVPGGSESDILERLRLRREQENNP